MVALRGRLSRSNRHNSQACRHNSQVCSRRLRRTLAALPALEVLTWHSKRSNNREEEVEVCSPPTNSADSVALKVLWSHLKPVPYQAALVRQAACLRTTSDRFL